MKNQLKRYLPPVLFFVFIAWMIIHADMNHKNLIIKIGHSVPWGDKIGHFTLFGIMALLLNMTIRFRQVKLYTRQFHLGSVIVFAFAVIEEFSQLALSTRTFDLVDMAFDLFGIGILSSVAFRRFVVKNLQEFTDYLKKNLYLDKQ